MGEAGRILTLRKDTWRGNLLLRNFFKLLFVIRYPAIFKYLWYQ